MTCFLYRSHKNPDKLFWASSVFALGFLLRTLIYIQPEKLHSLHLDSFLLPVSPKRTLTYTSIDNYWFSLRLPVSVTRITNPREPGIFWNAITGGGSLFSKLTLCQEEVGQNTLKSRLQSAVHKRLLVLKTSFILKCRSNLKVFFFTQITIFLQMMFSSSGQVFFLKKREKKGPPLYGQGGKKKLSRSYCSYEAYVSISSPAPGTLFLMVKHTGKSVFNSIIIF